MNEFCIILCILLASSYETHVILDNSIKTTKCDRYDDGSLSIPDSDMKTNIADYDPDVEICTLDAVGKPYCFTLWLNDSKGIELKKKGCIQSTDDCSGRSACISHVKKKSLHFCCCEGDLCNSEFSFVPVSPSLPEIDDGITFFELGTIAFFILVCSLGACFICRKSRYSLVNYKHQRIPVQVASSPSPSNSEGLRPIELVEMKVQGRFGSLWKAKFKNDYVAVKILPAEYHRLWLTEQDVFKLPNMNHDNILRFIAAEDRCKNVPKEYWIITEYQELGSLHDYLKLNVVTWEQLCIISFTMARGLAHLHEEIFNEKSGIFKPSIAHCDFKSANVLLKSDLSACIADFGFAYVFRSAICDTRLERIGTKRYMAPELLKGVVGFSNNAFLCMDMYACGLVLWEILSRCSAHEDAENAYKLPYEEELGQHFSFESIRELVVAQKKRPVLKEEWQKNDLLANACELIEDCWDEDAEARLSAACITERFSSYLRAIIRNETKLLYSIP